MKDIQEGKLGSQASHAPISPSQGRANTPTSSHCASAPDHGPSPTGPPNKVNSQL